MKLSEISSKDVIRSDDGVKLGRINDVTIDVATGKVLSIHINNGFKLSSLFLNKEQLFIPWSKIVKVGSDVIIVETNENNKMETQNKT